MNDLAERIQRYWSSCWNERRLDQLAEIFHDPYVHGASEGPLTRLADIINGTVRDAPDVRVEIRDLEVVGDTVVSRVRFVGTGGAMFGVTAAGKRWAVPSLDVFAFRDGRVARYWHLTDHLPMLKGLGADVRIDGEIATLD